jgi:hypothetical protein
MSKAERSSTENLFNHWRRGDAEAGKAMAQRFTDWYYAIAVCRMGEADADGPFRSACSSFSRGVVKVTDSRRLQGWAHGIARKQLHDHTPGGWVKDADLPNAFTRKQSPKATLSWARSHLPEQMQLLESVYRGEPCDTPRAVLTARYELKRWLRDHAKAPFKVVPTDPDPDRTPLPFYESNTMTFAGAELNFELYMLNEEEVCQDIAEFAHYAIALRGGLPQPAEKPRLELREAKPVPAEPRPEGEAPRPTGVENVPYQDQPTGMPFAISLVLLLAFVFAVMALVVNFYGG